MLIISAFKICKQCLKTALDSGGLVPDPYWGPWTPLYLSAPVGGLGNEVPRELKQFADIVQTVELIDILILDQSVSRWEG